MDQLRFSIPEILSLIGVAQCVYVLVYMAFRSGRLSRAGLPIFYFLVPGTAFFLDFAKYSVGEITRYYDHLQWFAWFSGPPLSVLLVVQIAQITRVPAWWQFWVLFLVPIAFAGAVFAASADSDCRLPDHCAALADWLVVCGLVAGGVSMLTIWLKRGLFSNILSQKTGRERYWLILALIVVNVLFLLGMLASVSLQVPETEMSLIRTVLGLGFVYLVSTSLFRIYPQAVRVTPSKEDGLTDEELEIALKIEKLMRLDKIYHETAYSRTDLAQELGAAESVVSKVINIHFGKSFPQLVNEHRVEDAKRLLRETGASIKTVSEEVGFNSMASFNRVFKEIEGETPTAYRKRQQQ